MSQEYSNPKRANDAHSLPDIEIFQLTAAEQVEQDEDLMWEAHKQFPLASMNSRDRDKAIEWAIEESGATGGYFWWSCLPGCLPDGPATGPFETYAEALADAREGIEEEDLDEDTILGTHALPDYFDIEYARACKWSCARCGMTVTDALTNPCKPDTDSTKTWRLDE